MRFFDIKPLLPLVQKKDRFFIKKEEKLLSLAVIKGVSKVKSRVVASVIPPSQ